MGFSDIQSLAYPGGGIHIALWGPNHSLVFISYCCCCYNIPNKQRKRGRVCWTLQVAHLGGRAWQRYEPAGRISAIARRQRSDRKCGQADSPQDNPYCLQQPSRTASSLGAACAHPWAYRETLKPRFLRRNCDSRFLTWETLLSPLSGAP